MKLEKDYFYVTGNYYLKTEGDTSIALVYPFPSDSLYGEVDSIIIYNISTGKLIEPYSFNQKAAVFKADFGGFNNIEILIAYRQKLLGNRAEYILESTAGWRKPLEQADYQLITPTDMEILIFSILPDEMIKTDEVKIYYWAKKNYMPDVNMIFEFEKR
jgi:hypothetical protein